MLFTSRFDESYKQNRHRSRSANMFGCLITPNIIALPLALYVGKCILVGDTYQNFQAHSTVHRGHKLKIKLLF